MVQGPESTRAYPTPRDPEVIFSREDVDWSASTMAFPMAADPPIAVVAHPVDGHGRPVDFTRSTGRYPTYDPVTPAAQPAKAKRSRA